MVKNPINPDITSWNSFFDELQDRLSKSSKYIENFLNQLDKKRKKILDNNLSDPALCFFLKNFNPKTEYSKLVLTNIDEFISKIREWEILENENSDILSFVLYYLDIYKSLLRSIKHSEVASDVMRQLNQMLILRQNEEQLINVSINIKNNLNALNIRSDEIEKRMITESNIFKENLKTLNDQSNEISEKTDQINNKIYKFKWFAALALPFVLLIVWFNMMPDEQNIDCLLKEMDAQNNKKIENLKNELAHANFDFDDDNLTNIEKKLANFEDQISTINEKINNMDENINTYGSETDVNKEKLISKTIKKESEAANYKEDSQFDDSEKKNNQQEKSPEQQNLNIVKSNQILDNKEEKPEQKELKPDESIKKDKIKSEHVISPQQPVDKNAEQQVKTKVLPEKLINKDQIVDSGDMSTNDKNAAKSLQEEDSPSKVIVTSSINNDKLQSQIKETNERVNKNEQQINLLLANVNNSTFNERFNKLEEKLNSLEKLRNTPSNSYTAPSDFTIKLDNKKQPNFWQTRTVPTNIPKREVPNIIPKSRPTTKPQTPNKRIPSNQKNQKAVVKTPRRTYPTTLPTQQVNQQASTKNNDDIMRQFQMFNDRFNAMENNMQSKIDKLSDALSEQEKMNMETIKLGNKVTERLRKYNENP